jgi:hypothetical protein
VIAFRSPEPSKLQEISMIAIQNQTNKEVKLYIIPPHQIDKKLSYYIKKIS